MANWNVIVDNTIRLQDGIRLMKLIGFDREDQTYFWRDLQDKRLVDWTSDGIVRTVNPAVDLKKIIQNGLLRFYSASEYKSRIATRLDIMERDREILSVAIDLLL